MNIIDALSKRIIYYLNLKGWSIYKLSRSTGLTPNCLQMIIQKNSHNVKLTTIILIAHAFGLSVSEFLDSSDFAYENLDFGNW